MSTAVVTGASGGVGAAVARMLARQGRELLLLGRDERRLAQLSEELGGRWLAGDLIDEAFLGAAAAQAERCSVLVHAAGVSMRKPHDELSAEDWHGVFDVNVFAVARLTSMLIGGLRASAGDVVLINSGAGQFASPGNSVYSASKHALKAYGDAMREEERAHGVRVIQVFPGYMDTGMVRGIAAQKGAEPDFDGMVPAESLAEVIGSALVLPHQATVEEITIRPSRRIVI